MKIIFDSEEEMHVFIDKHCPDNVPIEQCKASIDNCYAACKECWKKYAEIEVRG